MSSATRFERLMRGALPLMMLAGITGCASAQSSADTGRPPANPEVSMEITATGEIQLAPGTPAQLPLSVRLHNTGTRPIALRESTPCTVFRWRINTAQGRHIQSQPNRRCAQILATATLGASRRLEQSYVLLLDPELYTEHERYRLQYSFWGYPGHHDFTVRNLSN